MKRNPFKTDVLIQRTFHCLFKELMHIRQIATLILIRFCSVISVLRGVLKG